VTFLNCNIHSGPSSGVASWATFKNYWLIDWLIVAFLLLTLLNAVTFDLTTFAVYRLWCDKTLYQIWTQSSKLWRSYCDFNIWPNDHEHVLGVGLGSGIIFTKSDLRQLIRAWIILCYYANTLCHVVTLTFDPLTLKVCGASSVVWSKSIWKLSKIEQSLAEWVIILMWIFAHITPWPWPLRSYWWFSMFSLCSFRGWSTSDTRFSGGADSTSPNLVRTEDIERSSLHCMSVSVFGCLAAFPNAGSSELSDIENDGKFCIFWPLWKSGTGWGRSLDQL